MLMSIAGVLLSAMIIVFVLWATYKITDSEGLRSAVQWLYRIFDVFMLNDPILYVIPIILALAVLVNYLLTLRTTRRMNAVLGAVMQIQNGEYNVLLPNDNNDSLGELERNINLLAIQISDTLSQRKEIEKSKDDFIVNIAHDLRTPLTSIIGYLSFISDKQLTPEISAKYAGVAYNKSQQLKNMIESLFDIAHFAMDTVPLNIERVNLKKLLLQKQDELYPQLHVSGMDIRLNLAEDISDVYADGSLLARVFDNLIINAIRHAKDGKVIDIETEPWHDMVRISVITHANPVPPEELERIFDKLYRLDKSRDTATGGKGLGLSISRRIIELHGGTLAARQAGDGTAFDIYLPKRCKPR
jgi:signal transduction histidine kinase